MLHLGARLREGAESYANAWPTIFSCHRGAPIRAAGHAPADRAVTASASCLAGDDFAQAAMARRDSSVSDLCTELARERVTLYRYVGLKGELRDYGKRVLGLV